MADEKYDIINWFVVAMKNGHPMFGTTLSQTSIFTPKLSDYPGDFESCEQVFAIGINQGNVVRFEILKDRPKSNYINNIGPSGATQVIRSQFRVNQDELDEDFDAKEFRSYARNEAYDAINNVERSGMPLEGVNALKALFKYAVAIERTQNDD